MSALELKPCPFCGGVAEMLTIGLDARRVDCGRCDASTVGNTPERAAAAWNRRAPSLTPIGDRETIARIIDPGAFLHHEALLEFCILEGDEPTEARRYADQTYSSTMEVALAKADAILALGAGS